MSQSQIYNVQRYMSICIYKFTNCFLSSACLIKCQSLVNVNVDMFCTWNHEQTGKGEEVKPFYYEVTMKLVNEPKNSITFCLVCLSSFTNSKNIQIM